MTSRSAPSYRGRFAPTPSGPLHAGSLLAALASWLCARAAGGHWLLRIDDLDRARCRPEHADQILRQLEAHGLYWDETPRYQSQHIDAYRAALAELDSEGCLYRCCCTRAVLTRAQRQGPDGPVYTGHCRDLSLDDERNSVRFRTEPGRMALDDLGQGRIMRDISLDVGDFILRRADGVIGYHLACAMDESHQRITEVVRGADLLAATFCQRLVLDALKQQAPAYRHLPVLLDTHGRKLSKQNHASPIDPDRATHNLHDGLKLLGQYPPGSMLAATVAELLDWARLHWDPARIPFAY